MNTALSDHQKNELSTALLLTTPHSSSACRQCLDDANALMDQWFNEKESIRKLVTGRAWFIDQLLVQAWEHLVGKDINDIALVAVGGYGRGELHPCSDIDILILLQSDHVEHHRDGIEKFLTLLWDIHLKVGSSVRSIQQCADLGRQDLTAITSMIEARLLSGKQPLFEAMQDAISPVNMWPGPEYLRAKYNEQKKRHRKFNQTEYHLEPNLKSSPGGLRDLHIIGWIARRHYGIDDLQELVKLHLLTRHEYLIFERARQFLWQVRWALHRLVGRPEDRLLFDHQKALAAQFGYKNIENGALAVEQFMQRYYRSIMVLGVFNDLLLLHFNATIPDNGNQDSVIVLNERFQVNNGYLDAIEPQVFNDYPPAMIEAFVLMSNTPLIKGMTAATIRALRGAKHRIDHTFRNDPEVNRLFLELMKAPYALTASLRRMVRYGILGNYLPEFGYIIGQMQYDLFHNYTVDAHTLLTIKFLRRFNYEESQEQFSAACDAKKRLPKPELIYITALYHDIGKGRGGNHSELGAIDARHFAEQLKLSVADVALIEWLVRHHLVMSSTAQRQDLSDPETINNFAHFVGDTRRLDYLYCLTVADINATNPNLWNSWRASLLRELFQETRRALHRGLTNPIDKSERIEDTQTQARMALALQGVDITRAEQLWDRLGDDYFLRHNAPEIAWQTRGVLENCGATPLVLVQESTERRYEGGTAVFIYAPDLPHLFAICTAALRALNLTIHNARIITSTSGYALDTFIVLDAQTNKPLEQDTIRIERIRQHITRALTSNKPLPLRFNNYRVSRKLKNFAREPRITISNDPGNHRTIVEVKATDRPGLLASMGRVFAEQEVMIRNANISTLGEKVEDVFFVTDLQNNPVSDQDKIRTLHQALRQRLLDILNRDSKS